jgi:hydrogenase maturation protease
MTGTILVLGLGNVLWADEGFGVRCVEALEQDYNFPDHVRLVDGGTRGMALLDEMEGVGRMLIFDAVDYGLEPGSLRGIEADEIPRFIAMGKLSMHQTGFQDVLAFAQISGTLPPEIRLIGVQPVVLDEYGGDLSAPVQARLPEAVAMALGVLAQWGVRPARR